MKLPKINQIMKPKEKTSNETSQNKSGDVSKRNKLQMKLPKISHVMEPKEKTLDETFQNKSGDVSEGTKFLIKLLLGCTCPV